MKFGPRIPIRILTGLVIAAVLMKLVLLIVSVVYAQEIDAWWFGILAMCGVSEPVYFFAMVPLIVVFLWWRFKT